MAGTSGGILLLGRLSLARFNFWNPRRCRNSARRCPLNTHSKIKTWLNTAAFQFGNRCLRRANQLRKFTLPQLSPLAI